MIMELDDLKQIWKQTSGKNKLNTDIMELIQHKSQGPVAALKTVFKKQIILMSIIPLVLLLTNLNDVRIVLTSIMFWSYVAFCIGIIALAYYNYRIVTKMRGIDSVVKKNLEQQIILLEKRSKLELYVMRGVLLFFILLCEVVPYIQHYRMLDKWHSLSLIISTYTVLLLLQYFLNKRIRERKVGRHITYLKELVKEIQ